MYIQLDGKTYRVHEDKDKKGEYYILHSKRRKERLSTKRIKASQILKSMPMKKKKKVVPIIEPAALDFLKGQVLLCDTKQKHYEQILQAYREQESVLTKKLEEKQETPKKQETPEKQKKEELPYEAALQIEKDAFKAELQKQKTTMNRPFSQKKKKKKKKKKKQKTAAKT